MSTSEEHGDGSTYRTIENRKNRLSRATSNLKLLDSKKVLPREKRTAFSDIGSQTINSEQKIHSDDSARKLHDENEKYTIRREGTELIYTAVKKRKILEDKDAEDASVASVVPSITTPQEKLWQDLDTPEMDDVLLVAEYTDDIFAHLYSREVSTLPSHNYTYKSHEQYYRPSVRAILIDWLVEVHEKFQCFPETLLLAVNIMDRFLSKTTKVNTDKLQLVAVTSLFIAAKYEEIHLPKLAEYAYITAGAASKTAIKRAELFILTTLDFDVGWPNPLNFIRRISKADDYDTDTRNIAKYLLEYSICSFRFIGVKPSILATMSMYIARRIVNRNDELWNPTLQHYSGGISPLEDEQFQSYCNQLIESIVHPVAPIKSLATKYENSDIYGNILTSVNKWCAEQVDNGFDKLFSL
ncbi:S-phase entry cyclin-5 [Monosporozyma servazzii]